MDIKTILPLVATATLPVAAVAAKPSKSKPVKPNVIVILVDDQGYGGVNCYPHTDRIVTPHIDALAASGAMCMQGYTTGNVSSPTRAGLLTGRYQQSFGFYDLQAPSVGGIPLDQPLISEYLRGAGYKTACIGKWHVGDYVSNHPNNRGFDKFYGFINGLHDYFDPIVGGSWDGTYTGLAFTLDGFDPVIEMDYATYEYTDQAIGFIKQNRNDPFLVYLPYNAIHSPLQAPGDLLEEFADNPENIAKKDRIRAMTVALDNSVGRITSTLDELGLRENTIIFYLSDNGGVRGSSDLWELRGQKGNYFEGGIRVPFIVSYPAAIPAGTVYNEPVISLDIAPTILAAASVPDGGMDGVNLIPYLSGKKTGTPHEVLFWGLPLKDANKPAKNEFAVRQGKWKLVSDPHKEREWNLYDLEADHGETRGLKDVYPEKYKEMYAIYLDWIKSCPESIVHNGNARLSGQSLMNRYRDNKRKAGKPVKRMSFGEERENKVE